jgi:hypothetical protein
VKGEVRGGRLEFQPTLTSAREAHAAGELAAWSQAFLRMPGGNLGIAEPLLRENNINIYLLAEVGLEDLYPCSGPDPEFDFPVPRDQYERNVEAMMRAFEAGWDAPPLFAHLASFLLVDGTHRREALLRLGRPRYWAVLWMNHPPLRGRGQDPPW